MRCRIRTNKSFSSSGFSEDWALNSIPLNLLARVFVAGARLTSCLNSGRIAFAHREQRRQRKPNSQVPREIIRKTVVNSTLDFF